MAFGGRRGVNYRTYLFQLFYPRDDEAALHSLARPQGTSGVVGLRKWRLEGTRPSSRRCVSRFSSQPTPRRSPPAPIAPPVSASQSAVDIGQTPDDRDVMRQATELLSTIREWAAVIEDESWLCGYDADFPSFDRYLSQGRDPWLLDFLRWAETCRSLDMGLFLDY